MFHRPFASALSLFCLTAFWLSVPAFAQNVGDSCTGTNRAYTVSGSSNSLLICNGTTLELLEKALPTPVRKGIGTATPAARLHVNGEAIIGNSSLACSGTTEGAIRWNTTDNVHEYCNGTVWAKMVPECSAWPDDFSFSNVTGAALSSTQDSAIVQITGVSCGAGADVSITGGGSPQFRTCSNATCSTVVQNWTSTTTAIANNHYLQLRLTASPNSLTILTATVTVGGQARNWSVTTLDAGTFKRVFETSTNHQGNFGGVAGADAICATRASAAGLGGTWMAWVASDDSDDPESRFTHATIPYRRTDGALIANNWTDLTDGTISNAISRTEFGTGKGAWAWTNVNTDGTARDTTDCNNWTVNGSGTSGNRGDPAVSNSNWSYNDTQPCSVAQGLYCFQQ